MAFCPTREEVYEALIALMPRGRAWQTHDATTARRNASSGEDGAASTMRNMLYALAGPLHELEAAICASIEEMFAATAAEDRESWMEDFGLPDAGDPFGDDLVAKVFAQGGVSEDYYRSVPEKAGFDADLAFSPGRLHVTISAATSSAIPPITDFTNWVIGHSALGVPDAGRLATLLERIMPAHVEVTHEVV